MDLWQEFEMGEKVTGMWQDLGISAGTAVVILIALYFVIKWAVKNGMKEAYKDIAAKRPQGDLKIVKNDETSK